MFLKRTTIGGPACSCSAINAILSCLVGLVIDHFTGQFVVDVMLQLDAVGDDAIVVPLFGLDHFTDLSCVTKRLFRFLAIRSDFNFLAAQCQDAASFFFVVDPGELQSESMSA